MRRLFSLLCVLISIVGSYSEEDSVPVLIWRSERIAQSHQSPSVPAALEHVKYKDFANDYLNLVDTRDILLFLLDELSLEDLSSYQSELSTVASLMKNRESLFLPAVKGASFLVADPTITLKYNVIEVNPTNGFANVHLKNEENNFIVVNMPPTESNSNRKEAMREADAIIADGLSKLGDLAEFTVMLTAKTQSGFMARKSMEHRRIARQATDPPIINDVVKNVEGFYASKCVLAYFRGNVTIFDRKNNATYNLVNDRSVTAKADCQEKSNMLKLFYTNLKAYDKLHVEYHMMLQSGRRWILNRAEIWTEDTDEAHAMLYPVRNMTAVPVKQSYACMQKMVLKSNATKYINETRYELTINGLQLQAFTNNATKFGASWDCVGFFTIPIWMGLLSSLLSLMILLSGLYMLSDIKTMDRFDDPKGKHVMVHATAD